MAWQGIVNRNFTAEQFATYVPSLHFTNWRPSFVVLHNTSAPTLAQWHHTDGHQRMLNLESYYRDTMHWSAGPHLFVANDAIWAFTPLTVPGVHSPSWNRVSWGVEMVGEYETEPFDSGAGAKVRDLTVEALAVLHATMGFDSSSLRFHKEDPATTHNSCPGQHVHKADVVQRLHTRLAAIYAGEHDPQATDRLG